MKKLTLILCLILLPTLVHAGGGMMLGIVGGGTPAEAPASHGFTFIQSYGNNDAATINFASNEGAGHLVVAFLSWVSADTNTSASITDGTNPFTMGTVATLGAADRKSQLGWLLASPGGDKAWTITFPSGATTKSYTAMEFHYDGTISLDVQNTGVAGSSQTTGVTGNITTTGTSELAVGGVNTGGAGETWSSRLINEQASDTNSVQDAYTYITQFYSIFTATFTNGHAQASYNASSWWTANVVSFK